MPIRREKGSQHSRNVRGMNHLELKRESVAGLVNCCAFKYYVYSGSVQSLEKSFQCIDGATFFDIEFKDSMNVTQYDLLVAIT